MNYIKNFFKSSSQPIESGPKVFFDISINNEPQPRIVFRLYDSVVPKTAKNFREICAGSQQTMSGRNVLTYKNTIFHRIIPQFMIQGGDTDGLKGRGGQSIYGHKFRDEDFSIRHDRPFLLSMANAGPNTNGSQFFITTVPCPWLDGKHVVFGEVVEGQDVIKKVETMGTQSGMPKCVIKIDECGVVQESLEQS